MSPFTEAIFPRFLCFAVSSIFQAKRSSLFHLSFIFLAKRSSQSRLGVTVVLRSVMLPSSQSQRDGLPSSIFTLPSCLSHRPSRRRSSFCLYFVPRSFDVFEQRPSLSTDGIYQDCLVSVVFQFPLIGAVKGVRFFSVSSIFKAEGDLPSSFFPAKGGIIIIS